MTKQRLKGITIVRTTPSLSAITPALGYSASLGIQYSASWGIQYCIPKLALYCIPKLDTVQSLSAVCAAPLESRSGLRFSGAVLSFGHAKYITLNRSCDPHPSASGVCSSLNTPRNATLSNRSRLINRSKWHEHTPRSRLLPGLIVSCSHRTFAAAIYERQFCEGC